MHPGAAKNGSTARVYQQHARLARITQRESWLVPLIMYLRDDADCGDSKNADHGPQYSKRLLPRRLEGRLQNGPWSLHGGSPLNGSHHLHTSSMFISSTFQRNAKPLACSNRRPRGMLLAHGSSTKTLCQPSHDDIKNVVLQIVFAISTPGSDSYNCVVGSPGS